MKNRILILMTQLLPAYLGRAIKNVRRRNPVESLEFLGDVDHFSWRNGDKDRRALVLLAPEVWNRAVREYPNIVRYNHAGLTYSLVKALNENGYVVDLADPYHEIHLNRNYDLVVAHGGHCRSFIDQLPETTLVVQYISGLYWKVFQEESEARYRRFFGKHGGRRPETHRRDITPLIDGLEFLNRRAEVLFSIHCPRMVAAYGEYSCKIHFTGLGSYIDRQFDIPIEEKDFDEGRRNFIYVGGTGGNLQKGLDLLIEAFARVPELHLYIYCKVEEEIWKYCGKELSAPNIHYIHHWSYKPMRKRLGKLLPKVNFSVHAPINIGMGTAFMGTMGAGMIPVGYVDLLNPGESAVLTDSWQVDSLVECIRRASEKSPEWCRDASVEIRKKYHELCDPDVVEENFRKMFAMLRDW